MNERLTDPDDVGSSEYRAIHEVITDVCAEDDVDLARDICEEFITHALQIQAGMLRSPGRLSLLLRKVQTQLENMDLALRTPGVPASVAKDAFDIVMRDLEELIDNYSPSTP